MTQDEIDLILGRTCREYRDARNELGALKAKAQQVYGVLKNVGRKLDSAILGDIAECDAAIESLAHMEPLSAEEIQRLLDDLAESRKKVFQLGKHLEAMGYPPLK